jgi:predicted DCC family thiol-disulfide oxidoreductase YuxK
VAHVVSRPVLLYDTGCRLCRWAARLVVSLDRRRRLALLGLEDDAAEQLMKEVPREARLSSVRLVLPDGGRLSGGDAMLGTLAQTPATKPLALAVRALRAESVVDKLYRLVARNRGTLGRFVPDGQAPRRFP